jgi:WD40 repeat protein
VRRRIDLSVDLATDCCKALHARRLVVPYVRSMGTQTAPYSDTIDVGRSPSRPQLGTKIGQYEIIRLLGQGGMGEVYLARDLRLGRLVAIKRLIAAHPDLEMRFLAEAQATARCHHENIVVIHEVGAHAGRPYMVLEYLEGQTLRQWMRDRSDAAGGPSRLPPARAVDMMLPIVRALVYAHDQGIVHRDLKPENVMLTRSGVTKVLDFGIAKLLVEPELGPGAAGAARVAVTSSSLAGTLPYMSPEQVTLGAIDHRTDLWAVGIMLFELVTGAHPTRDISVPLPVFLADPDAALPSARDRVPEAGALARIIDRCLIKDAAHRTASARELLSELEALAPERRELAVAPGGSPFAGLAAFQEADAGRFFGRDRDIEQVIAELRSRPLVAVVGPSGAGKSSLVRAGVLPALKRSGEGWDAAIVRPGREPRAALAAALAQLDGSSRHGAIAAEAGDGLERGTVERLRAEPGYLGARLRVRATRKQRHIVLVVDQLEELFTLGVAPDERAAFLGCLVAVADDPTSPLRVLVTMRSDFLDRLTEDRRIGAEITRGLVLLPAMDRDGLREALVRPVEASDHRFEPPALVDLMVDAVAATPGALPLLQFTAARLWERRDRDRRRLTEASYQELGGVAGALAGHADTVLAGMSAAQQAVARGVFERLVTPERTRALVSLAELHALRSDPQRVDGVVQHLTAMRLVVVERGAEAADASVELVHESLIDRWPTLVRWLDENQDDAALLARLRAGARDWERHRQAAGLLWTGEVAQEARAWRQRYRGELAPAEQRYLAAVLAAAERTRRRRRRLFGAIVATAVLAAIVMAWLAWKQTEAGRTAAREAMRARDATRMTAMRALAGDPTTQLAILREIEDLHAPPPWAPQEARRLLYAGIAPVVLRGDAPLRSAAFSPDGERVVTTSDDGTVRVWSADGRGEPIVLRGHTAASTAAVFSPDGRRIASASEDRTLRIWSAEGRGEPVVLRGHEAAVRSVAFSPDGRRIVSASDDGTVRIWSVEGGGEPVVLRGHGAAVNAAAFSPDGQRIASASRDTTVRVWDAEGRGEPVVLRGHDTRVTAAAFSPDGRRIVSASWDKTVRIWSAEGRGEPVVLRGHDDAVISAAFSPDGQRVVSASSDKTVRVWDADGRGEPRVLRGQGDEVWSAAFSPDGQRVLSASQDGTAWIWQARDSGEPRVLRGHGDEVWSVAFSPDGQRIASASVDRTVRVWSADGRELLVLRGHDARVSSVAFSPDGQRIASASYDATVRVWRADGGGEPVVLHRDGSVAVWVAFSPDGRRIVAACSDKSVQVWDAAGRGEPLILRGHDDVVRSVAFSPDGRRIASGSYDRTVRIWNADGHGEPVVLHGHDDAVYAVAFSPDGQRVVSAAMDRTVRIWSADGRGDPVILRGHDDWVLWAEFSPDGRRVVSASKDTTIRIWAANGTGEPVILIGHDLAVEQARFSPDGRSIASASRDHTVRVWHDLTPATLDDPRLWSATNYCMSVDRRIKLLNVDREQAERDRRTCLARVERAHAQP